MRAAENRFRIAELIQAARRRIICQKHGIAKDDRGLCPRCEILAQIRIERDPEVTELVQKKRAQRKEAYMRRVANHKVMGLA